MRRSRAGCGTRFPDGVPWLAWVLVVAAAAAFAGVTFAACADADTRTQIVVLVEAEPGVRSQVQRLEVKVEGRDGSSDDGGVLRLDAPIETNWTAEGGDPVKIPIAPQGDDMNRVYLLTAVALDAAGMPIVTARLLSGFVPGEVRYVRLVLEDSCIAVACGQNQTCYGGGCADPTRDAKAFAANESSAPNATELPGSDSVPPVGGASETDGAPPLGSEGSVDAGADSGGVADASTSDAATCARTCQGKACGASDGCDGRCDQGSCAPPETCGGGGAPNVCGSADQLDQSQIATDYGFGLCTAACASGHWQEFVPSLPILTRVKVKIAKEGEPGGLSVSLTQSSGTELASRHFASSEIPASVAWIEAMFDPPVVLEVGSAYRIQLVADQTGDTSNMYSWLGMRLTNAYPAGVPSVESMTNWMGFDFAFETYGKD